MRVAPSTESRLARPWFARATWVGRVARGSIFVLPPFLTIAFGVLAARHEARGEAQEVERFARKAWGVAGRAVDRVHERRRQDELNWIEAVRSTRESFERRDEIEREFRVAVASDNACVRDAECMTSQGRVFIAYPRRRHEDLRTLPGGVPFRREMWMRPCGRRKEPVPVCRKNACALEERTVVHPPCPTAEQLDPMTRLILQDEMQGR